MEVDIMNLKGKCILVIGGAGLSFAAMTNVENLNTNH